MTILGQKPAADWGYHRPHDSSLNHSWYDSGGLWPLWFMSGAASVCCCHGLNHMILFGRQKHKIHYFYKSIVMFCLFVFGWNNENIWYFMEFFFWFSKFPGDIHCHASLLCIKLMIKLKLICRNLMQVAVFIALKFHSCFDLNCGVGWWCLLFRCDSISRNCSVNNPSVRQSVILVELYQ